MPFLPSLRSKRLRLPLSLLILLILFLLLGPSFHPSLNLPNNPLGPQASALASLTKPQLDQSGQKVQQDRQAEVDFQRSFEEPDFALLSGKQPHEIGCDVPIVWNTSSSSSSPSSPSPSASSSETGVLIFLGIFSAAQSSSSSPDQMRARRDLYRSLYLPHFPRNLVEYKFILGMPPGGGGGGSNAAGLVGRARVLRELRKEQEKEGDMVILDMEDNIDSGKTHKYFQWVANRYAGEGRVKGRPRFVVKSDDDTLLVMPNLISAFKDLDCSTNVYWGTSAGRSQYFGDYFRGLAYVMSWPLISWIGSADMPLAHITKIEDARTGQWLRHLDPVDDPIKRIDMGWTMGDWNQLDVGLETVGLHWCKWDDWVKEQHERIRTIWSDAKRPFQWDQGLDPALSIAKGKLTPDEAKREHQKQIEMGWDVEGNLKGDSGDG